MVRQGLPVVLGQWLRRGLGAAIAACILYMGVRYSFKRLPEDFAALEPTVPAGARMIVDKRYRWSREIAAGDIVLFSLDWGGRQRTGVSQVVGVPGDTVAVRDGKLTINDKVLEEGSARAKDCDLILGEGSYYLLKHRVWSRRVSYESRWAD